MLLPRNVALEGVVLSVEGALWSHCSNATLSMFECAGTGDICHWSPSENI